MHDTMFSDINSATECALLFPITISECYELVSVTMERAHIFLNCINNIDQKNRTFSNTAEYLDITINDLSASVSLLFVIQNVFPTKEIRDGSRDLMNKLNTFFIDNFSSNRKLYYALKDLKESESYQTEYMGKKGRDAEYSYWLEEKLSHCKLSGTELPENDFQKVTKLQEEIAELCIAFQQNINEDATELQFSTDALKGVSEDILTSLKKGDDHTYILKIDYPTYFEVLKSCEVASTRQAMYTAFNNRAYPLNNDVLRAVINKRHQLSLILGYVSYAHLSLEDKMAKSPDVVQSFIDELIPKLKRKCADEIELIKKNLHPSCSLIEGNLMPYDLIFMIDQIEKTLFNVDEAKIKEYFPIYSTMKAIFSICESFYDLTFTRIDNGHELWHNDVFTVVVKDNRTNKLLGHIILDLFPREGKCSHVCCCSVISPVRINNSKDEFYPGLSVVIANFSVGTNDQPSLFRHRDVQILFHEIGHGIHSLMGRSQMSMFSGTRVKLDFAELPSKIFEEWLWDTEILQMVSCHYQTKEALSKELIETKIRSKNAFSGFNTLCQLIHASYSLNIFGIPFSAQPIVRLDTSELLHDIQSRSIPGVSHMANTHMESSFGHLISQGASYYTHMWSAVFALDIFQYIKLHNGLLDPKMGRRYVDSIIGVGGGRDPNELLREFLGREPKNDAFFQSIGI
ncbi:unnamed protein product [Phytomonas sp. Hart1]|nr:unnamed protein product [Phytomonas sp. Hart1]|eukprot:CCW67913.1 unnamed protein product [Phytomonas sp. isolate Hart1]